MWLYPLHAVFYRLPPINRSVHHLPSLVNFLVFSSVCTQGLHFTYMADMVAGLDWLSLQYPFLFL